MKNERNYGIDLLRIISTMMIITLHVLGAGGVLEASKEVSGIHYGFFWMLEITCFCAVNCYALISGYVGYSESEHKHGYHKYFQLWFQVFCYSVIFWLIGHVMMPDLIGKTYIVKSFFPVTFGQYWYFTAYTGMFFLQPWLNRFIRRASFSEMKRLIVVFMLFSFYLSIVSSIADPFDVSNGYGMMWLCIMYFVGAWMKKAGIVEKLRVKNTICCGAILVFVTWMSKMVIPIITKKLFGVSFGSGTLVKYVSPTIVGVAVVLLVLFSKISFRSDRVKKIIAFVTPTTLGIYLIHTHPWVYKALLTGGFADVAEENILKALAIVLLAVVGIFLVCMLIERVRILLFRICKVHEICCVMEEFLRKKLGCIVNAGKRN